MQIPAGRFPFPPRPHAAGGGEHRRQRSVAALVIIALVGVATVLLVGMGLLNYHWENVQEREHMETHLKRDADQLAAGLSLPLWNFDSFQVGKILDSEMQTETMYGLVVIQSDPANPGQLVTYARSRGPSWQVLRKDPDISAPDLLMEERQISAAGEPIGRVKVFVTTRFLDRELRKRMFYTAGLVLAFDLLMVASLYFLLWRSVLKPLRAIERYAVAVKKGEGSAEPLSQCFRGELESLRLSIGDMVALLHARMEALLEKETTLWAVLDSVPQSVYWKDPDGRYLGCNRVFARAARLESPKDVVGKRDLDLPFHDEEIAVHQREDMEVIRTGEPRIHAVECLQTISGRTVWVDSTKVPILDAEGRVYAVLGVFEDITEQKLAEEERTRLQQQLNQSQKLESIGRLAGGVAHDNNNMLTAILMHAELLRELLGPDSPALRHIQAMEGAAERSTGLIRQLLAFSRKQVIEPKVVDLNDLLEAFRKSLALLIGEDIDFVLKPGKDLWKIRMDPAQVDQIVMNLVVNARDAMPEGGTISIETANVELDADYCKENPWASPGAFVALTVSDTGIGMTPEIKQKIFEPFFTTKEVGKGTGLGLSTVFGIVKQNGGFISVYSEPHMGTTFRIYLRRHTESEAPEPEAEHVPVETKGKGVILVVEDDEILREVIPRILDRLGYRFILAGSSGEALMICYQQETAIDILLTDVVMPGMSGKELWERVSAIRPEMKVIYMSGYTADVISQQGVLDSGVQFIQKPFSTADLGKKLRSVMGE